MAALVTERNWADLENDDEEVDGLVTYDNDGNRIETTYYREADGRQMKCERKRAVTKHVNRVPAVVRVRRAQWQKFGLEALDFSRVEDRKYQTKSFKQEEVLLPGKKVGLLTVSGEDEEFTGMADIVPPEPPKKLMTEISRMLEAVGSSNPRVVLQAVAAKEKKEVTVMPTESMPNARHADQDERTVRVTNLPDFVDETDIEVLFHRIGDVARHFLVRNKETNQSKGFAFVTFRSKDDARTAIETLHGKGFKGAILNVEWARRKEQ